MRHAAGWLGAAVFLVAALCLRPPDAHAGPGDLFVGTFASQTNVVYRISPGGAASLFGSTGTNNAVGIAVDAAGNVYVASNDNNAIEKFTPGGAGSLFATFPTPFTAPQGVAVDAAGNVYVGNATIVEKFGPGGAASVFASGFQAPLGLAFDASGTLFVSNSNASTIDKVSPQGTVTAFASAGLAAPTSIGVDAAGDVYSLNDKVVMNGQTIVSIDNYIEKTTPGGAGSLFIDYGTTLAGQPLPPAPSNLAVDAAGDVYAVFGASPVLGGYIEKYAPNGFGTIFVDGLQGPFSIAIQPAAPVPEPSAGASLLLGFAALGWFRTRRSPATSRAPRAPPCGRCAA